MACENDVLSLIQIEFNGQNIDPISGTAEIDFGGEVAEDGQTTDSGKYYASSTIKPSSVKCEVPLTNDFVLDNYRGVCGTLTVLASNGKTYVAYSAKLSATITVKAGEGRASMEWMGDVFEEL